MRMQQATKQCVFFAAPGTILVLMLTFVLGLDHCRENISTGIFRLHDNVQETSQIAWLLCNQDMTFDRTIVGFDM